MTSGSKGIKRPLKERVGKMSYERLDSLAWKCFGTVLERLLAATLEVILVCGGGGKTQSAPLRSGEAIGERQKYIRRFGAHKLSIKLALDCMQCKRVLSLFLFLLVYLLRSNRSMLHDD